MSKPTVHVHDFADRLTLADKLSQKIEAQLKKGIAARGHAVLAVSGGSTPKALFALLARTRVDWSKITVTLVDERWVPETSERSNAAMVRNLLLKQNAEKATFLPLYNGAKDPVAGSAELTKAIAALPTPFDVVVLGMGTDGHTASFFPGGDHLAQALDLKGKDTVVAMEANDAGEPRITLTLPRILDTEALFLHFEGEDKRKVFDEARAGGDYPIAAVLSQSKTPVDVYWSP
ncbi:6-phosphogluconolactonase [Pinirhizobacter sp.]|jgi:6-phosphogluconolactonase|uniref:6-phosphogluconolactonase n=1 Tax=Pinirhizobacter sp. TaxID=2950432 RepID=UPI002F406D28